MSVERQFEDRLCKTLYKDKQSAATKRNISKLQSLSLKDKAKVNSGDSKCADENIKKKRWKNGRRAVDSKIINEKNYKAKELVTTTDQTFTFQA